MENSTNQQLQEATTGAAQLQQRLEELNQTLVELSSGQGELGKIFANFTKNLNDGATNIQTIADALKKANLQFDQNAEILNSSNGSLQQNKAVLNDLLEQYDLLTKNQSDHSAAVQALNVKIGQLSNTIDDQENKLTKTREVFTAHKYCASTLGLIFNKLNLSTSVLFSAPLQLACMNLNVLRANL